MGACKISGQLTGGGEKSDIFAYIQLLFALVHVD